MKSKIIACIETMALLSVIFPFAIYAEDIKDNGKIFNKTESVYINTDSYGNTTLVNVYSNYDIANVDSIVDYGDYSSIEVITGDNTPVISGDKTIWNTTNEKRLGYIGKVNNNLAKQIPWEVSVKYFLNGVETLASELPHKSGLVKVLIKVIPNKEAPLTYQYNYMMEIKASFDMTNYLSVHSEDAIEAQVGNTKSLTFMILPGHEKEVSLEIGTEDFKMDGITFAMVPLEGDVLELVQDVIEDKKELRKAWDATNESLDIILNNLSNSSKNIEKIINGANGIQNGINSLNSETNDRITYLKEIKLELNALSGDFTIIDAKVSNALNDFDYLRKRIDDANKSIDSITKYAKELSLNLEENEKDLERLSKRSKGLKKDLSTLEDLLLDTKTAIAGVSSALGSVNSSSAMVNQNIYEDIEKVNNYIKQLEIKMEDVKEIDEDLYNDISNAVNNIKNKLNPVNEKIEDAQDSLKEAKNNGEKLSKSLKSLQTSLIDTAGVVEGLEEYSKDVPGTLESLNNSIQSINNITNELSSSIGDNLDFDKDKINLQINNLEELLTELQIVEKEVKNVHNTSQNTLSMLEKDINIVSKDIHNSTNKTIDGTSELLKNLKSITNQSGALKNAKNQIYDIITSDVDDIDNKTTIFKINPEMPLNSFVSSKNDSPKKVQIFVQTESIKEWAKKDTQDLENPKEKLSFWNKIVGIFEKIWNFFKGLFGIKSEKTA